MKRGVWAGLFGLFLLASNIALTQTHGWARVAVGVTAYLFLFGLIALGGLSRSNLGLGRVQARAGLLLGLRVSMVIAAGLLVAFLVLPETFLDERYRQSIWLAVAFALLVLPLETVLFEELVFRGVLWGMCAR